MAAGRYSKAQRLHESRALREKGPIAAEFEDCLQAFNQLSDALHLNQLHHLVERCWLKFNLWDNDSGASSRMLDYALKGSPSLSKQSISLLYDLRWTLGQAIVAVPLGELDEDEAIGLASSRLRHEIPASSVETALDEVDADFGPEPWLQEAFDIVDHLEQLLPALRNPFEEFTSPNAMAHDSEGYLLGHQHYQQIAHDLFPAADVVLLKRLAQAHWRTRCNLPGSLNTPDARSNSKDEPDTARRNPVSQAPARRQGWSICRKRESTRADSEAGTSTVRSQVETVMSRTAIVDQNSITSVGASSHSLLVHRPTVPDPPVERDQLGNVPFDCPHCHCELPLVVGAGSMTLGDWADHFYQDMKPYVCTFGDCLRRDIPFASREEWFRHELDFHRTLSLWMCGLCKTEFQHENEFKRHLQSAHSDFLMPKNLGPLIKSCKRLSHAGAAAQACLICHAACRNLVELERHLGNHMEAFVIETTHEIEHSTGNDHEKDDSMILEFVSEQMNIHAPGGAAGFVDDDYNIASETHVGRPGHDADADRIAEITDPLHNDGSEVRRTGSDWTEKVKSYLDAQMDAVATVQHNLPSQHENFAGREQDLLSMHESLSHPGRVCTVSGRSGIGKTATAVQYAYRFKDEFSYVFWVEAETAGILADKYESIADALNIDRENNQEDNSSIFRVRDVLSKLERRWLLIFDNVDNWTNVSPFITKALTQSRGSVLITTREERLPNAPSWLLRNNIKLGPLDREDGRELLLTSIYPRFRKDDLKEHEEFELAGKTVDLLGGLPLAISMVIGYVKESRCSLDDFHEMWDEKEARTRKPIKSNTANSEGIDSTIDALWDIGIREVQMNCRRLLDIMAFLDPDLIPRSLLVGDHEEDYLELLHSSETLRYKRMVKQLKSRRLITVKEMSNGEAMYSIHRMLKSKILDDMDDYSIADAFRKTFRLLRKKFPEADPQQVPSPDTWDACQEYMPHVESFYKIYRSERERIERLAGPQPLELAELFYDAGFYIWAKRGTAYDGLKLLRTAESILDGINLDRDEKIRADINCMLGLLLLEMGCADRRMGSEHLREARRIRTVISDKNPDDHDTDVLKTNAVSDYALSLMNNNRFDEAGESMLHCLKRYQMWGPESDNPFENSKFYGNNSIVLMFQGKMEEAIKSVEKCLELTERFSGRRAQYYRRLFLLACVHTQAGNFQKALDLHMETLEARLQQNGKHSNSFILSLYSVGASHYHLGNLEEATVYMKECLECASDTRWTVEGIARAQYHLGMLYDLQNIEEQKAKALKTEALKVLQGTMRSVTECLRDADDEIMKFDDLQPTWHGRYTGTTLLKALQANLPRSDGMQSHSHLA